MKRFITAFLFFLQIFTVCSAQSNGGTIEYRHRNTDLEGYISKPAGSGKAPGVVIIHAWMGITHQEKETADRLASSGYYALAADIYGKGIRPDPKDIKECSRLANHYYREGYKDYLDRIQIAIDEVVKQGADKDKIVIIGYCFGGFGALAAARNNFPVKGVVSFHGILSPDPDALTGSITPKILILHGADDPVQSKGADIDLQEEMRARMADWQMIYFGDTVHSFTYPAAGNNKSAGAAYNAVSDKRSWEYMQTFLKEILQ